MIELITNMVFKISNNYVSKRSIKDCDLILFCQLLKESIFPTNIINQAKFDIFRSL